MFGYEVVFVPLLITVLFCLLDHAINREVEAGEKARQVTCPYCRKPMPGGDLLKDCARCGGQVCPCCWIYDGEVLCQQCYIATRIGEDE